MIFQFICLTASILLGKAPPTADLVLKENHFISTGSIRAIVPLGKQYLCLGTWNGEIKIFDRMKNKVVASEESLRKVRTEPCIDSLVLHNNHLYALVLGKLFSYSFIWEEKNKSPQVGLAQLIDLKGEMVEKIWNVNGVVLCYTNSKKIYWLEAGHVLWGKSIDILKVAEDMVNENERKDDLFVKLVVVERDTKLLVASSHRLRVYDLGSMKITGDYLYEPRASFILDITFANDRYIMIFVQRLIIITSDGKNKFVKYKDDYQHITFVVTKNVLLMWTIVGKITVVSLQGEIGKSFDTPAFVCSSYIDGNVVYLGLSSHNFKDEYVGAYLLVYEIK